MRKNNSYLSSLLATAVVGSYIIACTPTGASSPSAPGAKVLNGQAQPTALARSAQEGGDSEAIPVGDEVRSYNSTLTPLNNDQAGVPTANGSAQLTLSSTTFTASLIATGLAPNTPQLAHVHTGTRCPTGADDTNNDGYIDAVEEAAISGQILIPFDANLAAQNGAPAEPTPGPSPGPSPEPSPEPSPTPSPTPGATPGSTPGNGSLAPEVYGFGLSLALQEGADGTANTTSDANGNFLFSGSANLSALLADLQASDPNPNDAFGKLAPGEGLNLSRRVIILHGVPATTALPPTVQSIEGLPPQATLPVACGEIDFIGSSLGGQPIPEPSPGPQPTASPEPEPEPQPTASPTPEPQPQPTASPTPEPQPQPTASPEQQQPASATR